MDSPVAVRFLWQVPTQIIFLTFFIFLQKEKTLNAVYLLFVLDIFTAVQFNGFTTIICEAKTV